MTFYGIPTPEPWMVIMFMILFFTAIGLAVIGLAALIAWGCS